MPAFRTAHGDDRDEVDAPLDAVRAQLLRADAQLAAAAVQLRAAADVEDRLARTTAERDELSGQLERLHSEMSARASGSRSALTAAAHRRALPRTRPALPRRAVGAVAVAAAVLGGATAVAAQLRDDPEPRADAASAGSGGEPAGSGAAALSGTTAGQPATAPSPVPPAPAAPPPLSPAVVPSGWTPYRAPDGSYALALPPGWRPAGPQRFVSASGLTVLSVRRGPLPAPPTLADVVRDEKRVAAVRPGYRRLAVRGLPFRGVRAAVWDYRYGRGRAAQQVSDLALAVDGTGYGLRVQSRESAWRFAAPLRDGLRRSFAAPGLPTR